MASLLRVDPPTELVFNGPFTEVSEKKIHLANVSDSDVCFKVKTTAPRRYCVRPNNGIIETGKEQDVLVLLQPFEYDPQDRNKHKFMVQCMQLTPEEKANYGSNTEPLFKDVEKSNPERILDTKLKCTFQVEAKNGQGTDRSAVGATGSLSEMQRLETEVSQLRQELSKSKEDNARLSQSNATLQLELSQKADLSTNAKAPGGSKSSVATIILILLALTCGAALGIWCAPMVSGEL
ncbi:vesicle-associated membrane protein-associated protein B-like [Convolutriloba macropyga]|uniref:vesicle-associated membrane protein-associated protein B-like n=1 Tax=Convolutriloba macropyga TaxID=536237 RepID=UPI003F520575